MMRSMICITCSSFWNVTLVSSRRPFTLDVDLLRAVDHHLGDRLVPQERLERPEAQDLVGDLLEHPHALGAGEGQALLVGDLAEELLDLAPDLDLVREVELRVELVDEPVLDAVLRLAERLARGEGAEERRGAAPPDAVGAPGGGAALVGPVVAGVCPAAGCGVVARQRWFWPRRPPAGRARSIRFSR